MKRLLTLVAVVAATGIAVATHVAKPSDRSWTTNFDIEASELVNTGRNPFFVLEPGYTLVLEDGQDRLVITVLNDTRRVDGVDTRVVEERETKGGALVEVSRNYFAMSQRTNAVYYFGEDVDMYKDGKIVSHEGAWLSGVNGARAGLIMPGQSLMGAKYYEEVAPNVAMDRAEVVGMDDVIRTPAGEFKNVLKIAETTPLEAGAREYKYYARGIGLIKDGDFALVKYGQAPR